MCSIHRLVREDATLQYFEEGARGKSKGFLAMKTLFIPAKLKLKIDKLVVISLSKKLPKKIAIAYSIQYEAIAQQIQRILKNRITKTLQVLGCSKPNFSKDTQSILLISDGKFHAISLAQETKLPVYLLENNKLIKISKKDIEDLEKKQKASYVKFLNASKVGVLISTKPGQQNLKKALDFKKKSKKQCFLFICNNVDAKEFENFGLTSWVNTACSRLDMENNSVINIDKIE